MRKRIDTRLAALEQERQVRWRDPQWVVCIETIGMPEAEAEALRAEAERLAMPLEQGPIRTVEVRCPSRGVDPDWAAREDRLTIWGHRP